MGGGECGNRVRIVASTPSSGPGPAAPAAESLPAPTHPARASVRLSCEPPLQRGCSCGERTAELAPRTMRSPVVGAEDLPALLVGVRYLRRCHFTRGPIRRVQDLERALYV